MPKKKPTKTTTELLDDYTEISPLASKFMLSLREQIEQLLISKDVTLGVPIECRVKSWESISDNIERYSLSFRNIFQIDDLIGIRLILLFKRDLELVNDILNENFKVIRQEDTSTRLEDTQFGYQSVHYIIKLPKSWLKIPSLRNFGKFQAEIQVRTLSQHIWAAASHKLQYKQETSVPQPVRRSMYRVSAILETVDLELERVLDERESYIASFDTSQEHAKLNVDLTQHILKELLPPENEIQPEPYDDLVKDLLHFNIDTVGKLRHLIESNLTYALNQDKIFVKNRPKNQKILQSSIRERFERGVFFTHVGLTRMAMKSQFKDKWESYMESQFQLTKTRQRVPNVRSKKT